MAKTPIGSNPWPPKTADNVWPPIHVSSQERGHRISVQIADNNLEGLSYRDHLLELGHALEQMACYFRVEAEKEAP